MSSKGCRRWFIGEVDADAYDAYFDALAAAGHDIHGEAGFVERLGVRSVLDAGCGTGRVARELARRGLEVVGVDNDPDMIDTARRKSPDLQWKVADLTTVDLQRRFDGIVMAGNVMIFLKPGTAGDVVTNMARHLKPGGLLVAGFQLGHSLSLDEYDRLAAGAGLERYERYATWTGDIWKGSSDYAISVHRRPVQDASPTVEPPYQDDATKR